MIDAVLARAHHGATVTFLEATFTGKHDVYGGWDTFATELVVVERR